MFKKFFAKKIASEIVKNIFSEEPKLNHNFLEIDNQDTLLDYFKSDLDNLEKLMKNGKDNNKIKIKVVKTIIGIYSNSLYGEDFWEEHLFDNTPYESFFREQIESSKNSIIFFRNFYRETSKFYYENYLEDNVNGKFNNVYEFVSHKIKNNDKALENFNFFKNNSKTLINSI